MSSHRTNPSYTPDDLLALPDGERYQLIAGRLVERPVGSQASYIGGQLFGLLAGHGEEGRLGWFWPGNNSYQCFPHAPQRVRRCSIAFIRFGRLPGGRAAVGHERVPPDLMAEGMSPDSLACEVDARIEDYTLDEGEPACTTSHGEGSGEMKHHPIE